MRPNPWMAVAMGCLVITGCSNSTAGDSTAPPPGSAASSSTVTPTTNGSLPTEPFAPSSTEPSSTPSSSTPSNTTTPPVESSVSTSPPDTTSPAPSSRFLVDVPGTVGTQLPPAGVDIDVAGEVYELIPKLYLFIPTQDSTTDANIEPPRPEDQAIIEAYARASAADYALITQNPVPGVTPDVPWNLSRSVKWQDEYAPIVQAAIDEGRHLDLSDGDLLRPFVIPELSDDKVAYIADCSLVHSDWVSDTTDDTVPGEPSGLEVLPWIVEMRFDSGGWQMHQRSADPRGCT